MAYSTTQIPQIVIDAYNDAVGASASISTIDTTNIVSLGQALSGFSLQDGWYSALTKRIVKTVVFARTYSADTRKILKDSTEWGAFVQKIYVIAPDAVDNPAFDIPASGAYTQHSPYDVVTPIQTQSLIYGNSGTWSYEFIVPHSQIMEAFTSVESMMAFIDGQFIAIQNKIELSKETLACTAVSTAIAHQSNESAVRNLVSEYNALTTPAGTLTAAEALTDKDFLKWASKEINKVVKFIQKPSIAFNTQNYMTHTPEDKLFVEVLTDFAQASEYYLESDTFHNQMVALPNYIEVPFWQYQGAAQSFADCSSIKIQHDDISQSAISLSNIVAVLRDEEAVACYFGFDREWSMPNPRDDISIYGYQYKRGYAVDTYANMVVFTLN